jgi:cyclophilin family peptidyl-prolyl cis-trans isomerase
VNRKYVYLMCVVLVLMASQCFAMGGTPPAQEGASMPKNVNVIVVMQTSKGTMKLELYPDKAPVTVQNFLSYVDRGFYDGTIFHRVMPNFMIQGGGFEKGMAQKPVSSPIKNEAGNSLTNDRGTIAMARTTDVDSATAQFFINVADNTFLNHQNDTSQGFGYCVFGKVIDGMDTAYAISMVQTHTLGYFDDVPVEDVVIMSVKRI